ncbi:hypothetical protein ACEU6E_05030 [Halorutilales archaeon Cl-col2-1]
MAESDTGETHDEYRSGYCNIGEYERRKRYTVAVLGFVASAVYVAVILLTEIPGYLVVGVFVPLTVGFEGYIQGKRSFCVTLGLLGKYSFSSEASGSDSGDVTDSEERRSDRLYALRITVTALTAAALTTTAIYIGVTSI